MHTSERLVNQTLGKILIWTKNSWFNFQEIPFNWLAGQVTRRVWQMSKTNFPRCDGSTRALKIRCSGSGLVQAGSIVFSNDLYADRCFVYFLSETHTRQKNFKVPWWKSHFFYKFFIRRKASITYRQRRNDSFINKAWKNMSCECYSF